jgi:Ca2+-binding RTX toxin-like protein
LTGGWRHDVIDGGAGQDTISGGAGDDTISGGAGNDVISGGPGDDSLLGGTGNDTLLGGDGDDTLSGGDGANRIEGGAGSNTVSFKHRADIPGGLRVDLGTMTMSARVAPATVIDRFFDVSSVEGSSRNDVIIGNQHANRLDGGMGDDTLTGGFGADVFLFDNTADIGWDVITDFSYSREIWLTWFSDLGSDGIAPLDDGAFWVHVRNMAGGQPLGDRKIELGFKDPWIWMEYEGENNEGYHVYTMGHRPLSTVDLLPGQIAPEPEEPGGPILADPGGDVLRGTSSPDTLLGGDGNDALYGSRGGDLLEGRGGADLLRGHAGEDVLLGGAGDDTLNGSEDDDILEGGLGNDRMGGEEGADLFLFDNRSYIGVDSIRDFDALDLLWTRVRIETNGFARTSDAAWLSLDPVGASFGSEVRLGFGDSALANAVLRYVGETTQGWHAYEL